MSPRPTVTSPHDVPAAPDTSAGATGTESPRPGPPDPPRGVRVARGPIDRRGRLVLLALLAGVALDVGFRADRLNVVVTVGLLAAVAVVATRPGISTTGRRVAIAAALPAAFLSVWSSDWVLLADLAAVLGLGVVAVAWSRDGSVFDATPADGATRVLRGVGHAFAGLVRLVVDGVPRGRASAVGRRLGVVLLVLPLLAVLVALLASADAVFSRLLVPQLQVGPVAGHLVAVGVLATGVVLVGLAVGVEGGDRDRRGWFDATDVSVVLGLAAAVLALFVASQVVAMTGAGQRLVAEAGLTPAEYARSGFFQLCWAAVVVVGYLAMARWLATTEAWASPWVRRLGAAVPLLSVGLVVVSLRRMALYDQAFGLTMLRLSVIAAGLWIGTVLVFVAVRNLGWRSDREWLLGASVAAGLAFLLVANLANPEAVVARHNLDRAANGAEVDVAYLDTLSDDAVPALADAIDAIDADPVGRPPVTRQALVNALDCEDDLAGLADWNLAAARADAVRARLCPTGGDG